MVQILIPSWFTVTLEVVLTNEPGVLLLRFCFGELAESFPGSHLPEDPQAHLQPLRSPSILSLFLDLQAYNSLVEAASLIEF